jgi:hypothetical protein
MILVGIQREVFYIRKFHNTICEHFVNAERHKKREPDFTLTLIKEVVI